MGTVRFLSRNGQHRARRVPYDFVHRCPRNMRSHSRRRARFAPITIRSTLNLLLAVRTPSARKSVPTTNSGSCSRPVSAGRQSFNCLRARLRVGFLPFFDLVCGCGRRCVRRQARRGDGHGRNHVQQDQLRLLRPGQRQRERQRLRRPLAEVGCEQNSVKTRTVVLWRRCRLRADRHHRAGGDAQQFLRHRAQGQLLKTSSSRVPITRRSIPFSSIAAATWSATGPCFTKVVSIFCPGPNPSTRALIRCSARSVPGRVREDSPTPHT